MVKYLVAMLLSLIACFTGGAADQADLGGVRSDIYYLDRAGKLVSESRLITGDADVYTALARAVLAPPGSPHLLTAVPRGTRLNGAWYDRGIVYIDFTKELFSYGGGAFQEQRLLAQIIYTLTGIKEVQRVQILIDGQPVLAPEGSPTDIPWTRCDLPLPVEEG